MALVDRLLPFGRVAASRLVCNSWIYLEGSETSLPQEALMGSVGGVSSSSANESKVDWNFASSVAAKVSKDQPYAHTYHGRSLDADLLELTAQAETLVENETGLVSNAGSAKAKTVSRLEWVEANFASFNRLLGPLLAKGSDGEQNGSANAGSANPFAKFFGSVSSSVGPKVVGAEMGALLGWMSGRVIGQYDLLIVEDERPEDQDWVYYVGPNVLNLEKRFGFPPREFRLWIAIHECTHRAQFTGVPWLREYFLSMANELIDSVDPDPKRLVEALGDIRKRRRLGSGNEGGLSTLLATPQQRETLNRMTGLMSLLEGHGDVVMDRAGEGLIPSRQRFSQVMSERRKNATGLTKVFHRLLGLEAKLAQYEEGESFIHSVENRGGSDLFNKVWSGPEALPTIEEIRQPDLWIARMDIKAGV